MADEPQKQSVVGEDGELIQPDRTIDEAAYAEYVATHVHRDPLIFRVREHVKEWGCAYLFVTPFIIGVIGLAISLGGLDDSTKLLGWLELVIIVAGAYWTLHRDTRQ